MRRRVHAFLLLVALLIPVAVTKQTGALGEAEETELGRPAAAEIERRYRLVDDDDLVRYVDALGQVLPLAA